MNESVVGGAPLELVLHTEVLEQRLSRPPQHAKENDALLGLARTLADTPQSILQKLADTILDLLRCGSAGVSLVKVIDGAERFYWPAISGRWKPHIGSGTPREFGPCGDVLDHDKPLLFQQFQRRYTYFQAVSPQMEEALLSPFYVRGKAVGTIWAVAHDDSRKFDAEDKRLLCSLAIFASSAYQAVESLESLRKNEEQLRSHAGLLESQVLLRTEQLEKRANEVTTQAEQLRDLSLRLQQAQDVERRHVARELHDSVGQTVAALGFNLANIARQVKGHAPNVVRLAEEGQKMVEELGQEIRTTSYLLHPPLLEEAGLYQALRWYVDGLQNRSPLRIYLEVPQDLGRLSTELELTIFRLVQECLTNVHRHAVSENATISIAHVGELVRLEIRDDGKGMAAVKLADVQSRGSGVGIRAMRERIHPFGGTMDIDSNESGTTVRFTFPYAKPDAAILRWDGTTAP
ncbi:MAG TPA: GAF domain-containing sensor histidine kinase [Candidatus Acidoferrales bacterium]|nr:GAF domain-containing sensor histidine kinase [Candidatus Acidoferrales bacterium]